MADVECITLEEDEDLDHLHGAGRIANHPQMVWSYFSVSQDFSTLHELCLGALRNVC